MSELNGTMAVVPIWVTTDSEVRQVVASQVPEVIGPVSLCSESSTKN